MADTLNRLAARDFASPAASRLQTATVTIETGTVRGELHEGYRVFRGIPYGSAPTEGARFAPAAPAVPWVGTLDATKFGPAAPQRQSAFEAGTPAALAPDYPWSEDCLTLNVWTPADTAGPHPVMVWLHGGAYRYGGPQLPIYDGRFLAELGSAIVVSVVYRLGPLGFLAHPDLGEDGYIGNAGLHDQLLALRWVRDNIAAFGGDPGAVTIFGESAGGSAVTLLLSSPLTRGLAQRAIIQSGPAKVDTVADATDIAERLARHLGLSNVRELRNAPAEQLLEAEVWLQTEVSSAIVFLPVADQTFLPDSPLDAIAAGDGLAVPAIVGTNRDEWRLQAAKDASVPGMTEPTLLTRLEGFLADDAEEVVDLYRSARTEAGLNVAPESLWSAIFGDMYFRLPAQRTLAALDQAGSATWSYLVAWESPNRNLLACHEIEIPLAFGTFDLTPEIATFAGNSPAAAHLSQVLLGHWASFAASSDPAAPDTGGWQRWSRTQTRTRVFSGDRSENYEPVRPELLRLAELVPASGRGVRSTRIKAEEAEQ